VGHQEYSIQVDEILLAVGRALHNWSRVEEAIVDVLWRCMETRTSEPARIVWDSINITPSRLKMLQEMVSFAARDDQANALWAELADAFLKHEMIRRDLAQYQLVRFGDGPRLARASRRASATKQNLSIRYQSCSACHMPEPSTRHQTSITQPGASSNCGKTSTGSANGCWSSSVSRMNTRRRHRRSSQRSCQKHLVRPELII
jgi:hypothetical protein